MKQTKTAINAIYFQISFLLSVHVHMHSDTKKGRKEEEKRRRNVIMVVFKSSFYSSQMQPFFSFACITHTSGRPGILLQLAQILIQTVCMGDLI
jgi:hypothetical protein